MIKPMVWDVTVVDTYAVTNIYSSEIKATSTAQNAKEAKSSKYGTVNQSYGIVSSAPKAVPSHVNVVESNDGLVPSYLSDLISVRNTVNKTRESYQMCLNVPDSDHEHTGFLSICTSTVERSIEDFRFDYWHLISWMDQRVRWPKTIIRDEEPFQLPAGFGEHLWIPDMIALPLKEMKKMKGHNTLETILLYKNSTITHATLSSPNLTGINGSTHDKVKRAGETFVLKLYGASNFESLDKYRHIAYKRAIGRCSPSSSFQLASLPPTSAAAKKHSYRTYHTVQEWMGNTLPPIEWGWRSHDGTLAPVETDRPVAPESLLNMVSFTTRVNCAMDLATYPMDTQVCSVIFKSGNSIESRKLKYLIRVNFDLEPVSNTNRTLSLVWGDPPVSVIEKQGQFAFSLPEFTVRYFVGENSEEYIEEVKGTVVGLNVTFVFKRIITGHLLQTFLPSSLLVLISWLTFCIPTDTTAQRVIVTMTAVISLSTQLSGVQSRLPPVSYVRAIDVWYITCLFFVFAVLVELATVSAFLWKAKSFQKYSIKCRANQNENKDFLKKAGRMKRVVVLTERISRIFIPSMFAFFNLVYWSYYMVRSANPTAYKTKDTESSYIGMANRSQLLNQISRTKAVSIVNKSILHATFVLRQSERSFHLISHFSCSSPLSGNNN
ncbi:Gamma-aminobutyric acid receptor subunit beta [Nymphon striatum]|nr:Gamma-aminobutyric acid receptor subunit beta [Nymphon striatum]